MKSTPHVSPALRRLRGWVTFIGLLVGVCASIKLMAFGFVHFTDVRYTTLEAGPKPKSQLAVVHSPPSSAKPRVEHGRIIPEIPAPDREVVDPNRVLSRADTNLRHASEFASAVGLVAAILLAFLATLGTLVAAGGAVPGIERTVASCIWSVVMLLFCIPWPDIAGSIQIPGVFTSYRAVVDASEAVADKELAHATLWASFVLLPALVLGCSVGVVIVFRAGVRAGTIVTAVSELDEAIDKELSLIQERGVATRQPKSVGALFRAMGDEVDPAGVPASIPGLSGGLRVRPEESGRSLSDASPGRPLPRPI